MIEKELKKRNVPDLFFGEESVSVDVWENSIKPKWKDILLTEEYGFFPTRLIPTIRTKLNAETFSGKATWEEVFFTFENDGKTHEIKTNLIYPKDKTDLPFFIFLNFRPDVPDKALPIDFILDSGYGVFIACRNDITEDNGDFESGLAGLFKREQTNVEYGKLVIWAYMAMQMMDYLQTRAEPNKEKIGVIGHSRLGKAALLAGAFDNRFSFVCANESGCSGAALSRKGYEWAEKIEHITATFPYWFCNNYQKYAKNEDNLPFDQHALISLIAPRSVYVGGAVEDTWADNDNQFLSCVAASKVWELYGKKGIVCLDRLPIERDSFMDGNVGFFLRSGVHSLTLFDWETYIKALNKKFN